MASRDIPDDLVALAWSLWAELGVSGWERKHSDWFIDPEPLILFTAWLGDTDARLRDEVTDWCISYGSWISGTRLQNLATDYDDETRARFGELAATVAEHSSTRWRGATRARKFKPSGKSRLESFSAKSLVGFRIRALCGVGAKAELMRIFISADGGPASAASLVSEAGFKKRNLSDALESLRLAGLLEKTAKQNRQLYRLAGKGEWSAILGAWPRTWLTWTQVLPLLAHATDSVARIRPMSERLRVVATVDAIEPLVDLFNDSNLSAGDQPLPRATRDIETLARWRDKLAIDLARAGSNVVG